MCAGPVQYRITEREHQILQSAATCAADLDPNYCFAGRSAMPQAYAASAWHAPHLPLQVFHGLPPPSLCRICSWPPRHAKHALYGTPTWLQTVGVPLHISAYTSA